jgi:sugar lactone lactonase YvrE
MSISTKTTAVAAALLCLTPPALGALPVLPAPPAEAASLTRPASPAQIASSARGALLAQVSARPVGDVRVLVHLDQAAGQQPENIALEPDGSADLTFAYTGQVARVDPAGQVRIIAQVPVPADGDVPNNHSKIFLGGIVRAPDGTLYFAVSTGTAGATGVYRLRPGGVPVRVAALPADTFLNGMAADWTRGTLYVADSAHPVIWSVPANGATPAHGTTLAYRSTSAHGGVSAYRGAPAHGGGVPGEWVTGDALAPTGGFGANGVKVHDGAVWVSNIGAGTLLRIPIRAGGGSGVPRVVARGLGPVDDFAFTGPGRTVLAAVNQDDRVVLIDPHGHATTVLTSADGLDNPTSVAVRGRTVYVTDGAYFAGHDPGLLTATLAADVR